MSDKRSRIAIGWLGLVVLLALLAGCGSGGPGIEMGPLTCASGQGDSSVFDYTSDAVGYETIADAIAAFRSSPQWALRADWAELQQGPTDSSPVLFVNRRGWVHLVVDAVRLNDTWVVGSYTSCSP